MAGDELKRGLKTDELEELTWQGNFWSLLGLVFQKDPLAAN